MEKVELRCLSWRLDYCGRSLLLVWKLLFDFNPDWHELWKQEKCSSLALPRGTFYKSQWAWQGVKSTPLMSIFTSSLESLDKKSAEKIWSKYDKEIKVSPLMPIRVNKDQKFVSLGNFSSKIEMPQIGSTQLGTLSALLGWALEKFIVIM